MSSSFSNPQGLGSLAQSARGKHLKQARNIMLFIGILTIVFSAVIFALAEKANLNVPANALKVAAAITFGEGVIFVVLGLLVKKFPVPATLAGLILYAGDWAIGIMQDPSNIGRGIFIKIILIACLVKAVQAAIAYQKEQKEAAMRVKPMGVDI